MLGKLYVPPDALALTLPLADKRHAVLETPFVTDILASFVTLLFEPFVHLTVQLSVVELVPILLCERVVPLILNLPLLSATSDNFAVSVVAAFLCHTES